MAGLIWLHEEALRADHPVFAAGLGATALFCWDVDYMAAADIGLRRQIFIYESLLELDVTIIRGVASQVLPLVVWRDQVKQLYVPDTPNPLIRQRAIEGYGRACRRCGGAGVRSAFCSASGNARPWPVLPLLEKGPKTGAT